MCHWGNNRVVFTFKEKNTSESLFIFMVQSYLRIFREGKDRTFQNGLYDYLFICLSFRSWFLFHKALGLKQTPEAKTKSLLQPWMHLLCWVDERIITPTCTDLQPCFNMFFFTESEFCLYTTPKLGATNLSEFEEFSLKRKKLQVTLKYSYFFETEPKYWGQQW